MLLDCVFGRWSEHPVQGVWAALLHKVCTYNTYVWNLHAHILKNHVPQRPTNTVPYPPTVKPEVDPEENFLIQLNRRTGHS
ncbi:hypothetical protein NC652_021085 [Populus alba x Populus x berolinensis]|nr:hypothetical protein NC652_021085 [Populus alba x Populus x berolinensis]